MNRLTVSLQVESLEFEPPLLGAVHGHGERCSGHRHDELLATEAAGHVGRAHACRKHVTEAPQYLISDRVPVPVIDAFEVVQVDHDQAERQVLAAQSRQLSLQRFVEVAAVEQAGQRIANSLFAQLRIERLDLLHPGFELSVRLAQRILSTSTLGDVLLDSDEMGDPAPRPEHRGDRLLFVVEGSISPSIDDLSGPGVAPEDGLPQVAIERLIVDARTEESEVLAQDFVQGVTGQLREGRIGPEHMAHGVTDNDAVGRGLESGVLQSRQVIAGATVSLVAERDHCVWPPIELHPSDSQADIDRYYDSGEGYLYSRYGNPTTGQAERLLADLEGTGDAALFSSGMAAISTLMLTLVGAGQRVAAQRELPRLDEKLYLEVFGSPPAGAPISAR